MIERKCETCERRASPGFILCAIDAQQRCGHGLPYWISSRAALEAEVERLTKERHDALAQAAARDEEIATLRAQAEDWAAQYRALSASVESELGGLRHTLSEVEDERDEAVSAMAEWRARAEVAEPERDRLRDGVVEAAAGLEAAVVAPADAGALSTVIARTGDTLRALLGEAKGGGAS